VLVAIVLGHSDRSRTAGEVIGSALAFALFSLPALAGVVVVRRRSGGLALIGVLTVLVSLAALFETVSYVWSNRFVGDEGRAVAELAIAALGAGQVSLLFAYRPPFEHPLVSWVRLGAVAGIALAAILAIAEVSDSGPDVSYRTIAVALIVYVLGALLLPLLQRALGPDDDARAGSSLSG
jgi:hypothetical protein